MSDDPSSAPAAHQEILSVVTQFWRALDARDSAGARALAADDFAVIDAFPPHVWSGPEALSAWLGNLWAFCDGLGITIGQTTLREASRCTVSGDHGYVVMPATIASAGDQDLMTQKGVVTAALRRVDGRWLIAGLCWAGQ